MITLGLIGKEIQHSESPFVYQKLLSQKLNYKLFDIKAVEQMPTLDEIFQQVDGLSITSPYKRLFYEQVEVFDQNEGLDAINCVAKRSGKYVGTNTDFMATQDLLNEILQRYRIDGVIIIGDGVMASIVEKILFKKGISCQIISRKRGYDLNQLNLCPAIEIRQERALIINACARSYIFKGRIHSSAIFWNLNYSQPEQEASVAPMVQKYIDGRSLLELQAKYALKFWNLID